MPETETADTTQPTDQQQGAERPLSLLAKGYYGDSYHGEVEEQKADDPPEDPEGQKEEAETEEAQASEEEADADDTPDDGADDEGEDGEVAISSVDELIETQEWDREWFNSLEVPVKVDGEPAKAKLSDLVANYQINRAADKRLEEAKAKREAHTKEIAEKEKQLEGQFATAAKLIEGAEKLLDADSSSIDWNALKADDPAEYSAKKIEFQERRDAIEKAKSEAVESYQKMVQEGQKKAQEEFQEQLLKEQEKLLEKLPEWNDPVKAKEEQSQLRNYLIEQGFTEQDVMGASDHRLILLARKAMLFDTGQKKVNAAKKKVRKVPKVMKPGAPKPQQQANREKADKARAKLRQSGSIDDAFLALKAKRGG